MAHLLGITGMSLEDNDKEKRKNIFARVGESISSLSRVEIAPSSSESLRQSIEDQENKVKTIEKATEVVNTVKDILSLLPFSSIAEVGANVSEGNYGIALGILPFVVLDAATLEGCIIRSIPPQYFYEINSFQFVTYSIRKALFTSYLPSLTVNWAVNDRK